MNVFIGEGDVLQDRQEATFPIQAVDEMTQGMNADQWMQGPAMVARGQVGGTGYSQRRSGEHGANRHAFSQLDGKTLSDRGVIIAGNPESCIKTCQMYEDIGVNQVILIMQTETIPHDKVMGSIEKFGKEVIPALKESTTKAGAAD